MPQDAPPLVRSLPTERQQQIELLHYYRSEIRFESSLIAERVSALLNSQAFLVIAYASSMSTAAMRPAQPMLLLLPVLLTLLGLLLALLAWPGIRAAHSVIDRWTIRERDMREQIAELHLFYLDSDEITRRELARDSFQGSLFSRQAPVAFIGAWCFFGILPIWLYLV